MLPKTLMERLERKSVFSIYRKNILLTSVVGWMAQLQASWAAHGTLEDG